MRMRDNVKVFTLASVALLSCRAVLGIEEIEEGTTDGGTAGDAAADSIGTDSATVDSGVDTGVDAGACSGKTGNDCGKCCRDLNPGGNKELEGIIKTCVCDGGCTPNPTDCQATTVCGGGSDPKDTGCIPCIDTKIKGDMCPKERDDCKKSSNCKVVYDCLAVCK
jgi:hypothetical protein